MRLSFSKGRGVFLIQTFTMLRYILLIGMLMGQLHSQTLPPKVMKIVGIEAGALLPLTDSTFYLEVLKHRDIQNPGLSYFHLNILGEILDSFSIEYTDTSSNYLRIGGYPGFKPILFPGKTIISAFDLQDSIFSPVFNPVFVKIQLKSTVDTILTNKLDVRGSDTTYSACVCTKVLSISDSTFLAYGACQRNGSFNGHLELSNWAAILDTNLNVLQQRMYPRTASNQPLRLNFYNAIKAPDGGFIFGTEGRLVPDGILPQFGGLTKLDSNLNVEWEYIFPTPKINQQLTVTQLFTFTLPSDSNHFYAFQTFADSCTLGPNWVYCGSVNHQLFNRRFLKFNWSGQLVSQRVDTIKKRGYFSLDVAVDTNSIVVVGSIPTKFTGSGFVERYNHDFDILWHVQPDAVMPEPDTTIFQFAQTHLSTVALNGDKIIVGGKYFDPDLFPDPYQFAYVNVIDTNGSYLDGTPIGAWSWLSDVMQEQDWTYQVYPLPATEYITLEISAAAQASKAVLYDLSGRKLLEQSLQRHDIQHEIPLHTLPNGTYLLHVEGTDGLIGITKVVVQR
jgi:hypothetical protein